MNTFGNRLRLTTFGESHGKAIGGVIDGYPSGIKIDFEFLAQRMMERRPGRPDTSSRREDDFPEFLSGISEEGISLGTPISFLIHNRDIRSEDYENLKGLFRPNHADFTYHAKYGIRDHRGGGRASARETACRVVAGALAEQLLKEKKVFVDAYLSSVGNAEGDRDAMYNEILEAKSANDSIGGMVTCVIDGLEAGVGEPVYDKLSARLAYAMLSINAAKGFELGDGFDLCKRRGSEVVDRFYKDADGTFRTFSNHSGGIQGGISNGMPIVFRVAFKPTPTIGKPLPLIDKDGKEKTESIKGRHDPCVAVRAVSVVRAMAALVIADYLSY